MFLFRHKPLFAAILLGFSSFALVSHSARADAFSGSDFEAPAFPTNSSSSAANNAATANASDASPAVASIGSNGGNNDYSSQPEIQTPASSVIFIHPDALLQSQDEDLWNRIRNGYGIPNLENPLVSSQVNWYSSRADYIKRTTERASRYLYHVVEELEKRGMPTELALLPFIESAFNPQAISSAKASGMWQFIPSTGRDFNLKQNMFTDERRGVLDSTDAALNYLQKLYGMFGDWQLALAAYNWGEGSVQRAIKKQQAAGLPIDFNSMSYLMPSETRNYVPKLQAVKNIISNPELFRISLPKVDNQPYFVTIDKTRDIDVRVAAKLAELSMAEFTALNPQFSRPVITGNSDTKILLPADNVAIFKSNLSKWEGPLSSWTAYKVTKNEKVESIAQRLGTSAAILINVNKLPAHMLVKAGSTLLVPRTEQTSDSDISQQVTDNAVITMARESAPLRKVTIKTGKRDSLASIAKRYKVSVAQIKEWNNLSRDSLSAGQRLQIQVASGPARRGASSRMVASTSRKAQRPTLIRRTQRVAAVQTRGHKRPG